VSRLALQALGAAADAVDRHVPTLVDEQFASRLLARDATLWGPAAESEASRRLAWVDLYRTSRPLVGEIEALADEVRGRGLDRVVLCGMGGSSLAPEVICATAGVPLVVLDSSHPDMVRSCLEQDLGRTVVVVSSKSGSTVETDSQRRAFEAAFREAGLDPAEHIVVVTDPGSPLDQASREAGYRVVNADPHVGGRYSALTAFGLVPAGLAGVDVGELLDEAESVADLLYEDDRGNPGLTLGAAIAGTRPLRDKLVFTDDGSGIPGFADWAEQLIAESTGKDGTGLLPVIASPTTAQILEGATDVTRISLAGDPDDGDAAPAGDAPASLITVSGSLGAQLLLWEVATAVAGRILGINPFDQPDVESAKEAARRQMGSGPGGALAEGRRDGAVVIRGATGARDLTEAVDDLLARVDPETGYLAVMVYLDRLGHAGLEEVADTLTARTGRPVTFGWGPRFLHSTGQLHKGGPATGVYLQVTGEPRQDLPVPGRDYTFGRLIAAQAAGDADVLQELGRPVLRLHLTDLEAGLAQLRAALGPDAGGRA
jgi:glucose-6-phosphate isomerase